MATTYTTTGNLGLDLYGDNDPADLRGGYNSSMRKIDSAVKANTDAISSKADSATTYSKLDVDSKLSSAAVTATTYSKTDIDTKLSNNVDAVAGYVNAQDTNPNPLQSALFGFFTRVFDTVDDMKAAPFLIAGMKCRTLGYYAIGDGGGADYQIVSGNYDEFYYENISDKLSAKCLNLTLKNQPFINTAYFGVINNNDNATQKLAKIFEDVLTRHLQATIYIDSGTYHITQSLSVPERCILKGCSWSGYVEETTVLYWDNPSAGSTCLALGNGTSLQEITVKSNAFNVVETRSNGTSNWISYTANVSNVIGIKTSYSYVNKVTVSGFGTGILFDGWSPLSSDIQINRCDTGMLFTYPDSNVNNVFISSCRVGINTLGTQHTLIQNVRMDGIGEYGVNTGYGNSFLELNLDYIGIAGVRVEQGCVEISGIFSRVGVNGAMPRNETEYTVSNIHCGAVLFGGRTVQALTLIRGCVREGAIDDGSNRQTPVAVLAQEYGDSAPRIKADLSIKFATAYTDFSKTKTFLTKLMFNSNEDYFQNYGYISMFSEIYKFSDHDVKILNPVALQ